MTDQTAQEAPAMQADQAPVTILAQYIRDLSFENPNAPGSLRGGTRAPELGLNIGMDARKLPADQAWQNTPNTFEVVLTVRAEAKRDDQVVFLVEMQYAVLASIDARVPEETHHPLLLIEMPRLAFPFVRQIMVDLTVNGGFPPLMLSPVDFQSLYMKQFGGAPQQVQTDAA